MSAPIEVFRPPYRPYRWWWHCRICERVASYASQPYALYYGLTHAALHACTAANPIGKPWHHAGCPHVARPSPLPASTSSPAPGATGSISTLGIVLPEGFFGQPLRQPPGSPRPDLGRRQH